MKVHQKYLYLNNTQFNPFMFGIIINVLVLLQRCFHSHASRMDNNKGIKLEIILFCWCAHAKVSGKCYILPQIRCDRSGHTKSA